jgi:pimeloyl-ACP methyl ester carboxylesterase
MSAITINGDLVHYEKLGRGRPVILVHGWIGSWRYWIPLMQKLHLKYSVYTLDLIGFGDSAKNDANYGIEAQVKMLDQFLDHLGIPKVAIIAHGLGALVSTHYALHNPVRVARMLLTSLPLFDPGDLDHRTPAGTRRLLTGNDTRFSLAPRIEDLDESELTMLSAGNLTPDDRNELTIPNPRSARITPDHELPTIGRPQIDRDALRRAAEARKKSNMLQDHFKDRTLLSLLDRCFKKTEPEFEKLRVDVEKTDDRVLLKTVEGYEAGTMLDDLRRLTAPVVAVHGIDDPVLPVPGEDIWNYLTLEKEDVFVPIPLPNVRHFPMLEHDAYSRLATDFLEAADISKIEVRERWRRRSR